MTGRLNGKVAVVTGGCSGIGLATVNRFVEEGAKVVIGDIDDQRGHELVGQLGGEELVKYVRVDVTNKEEVDALFQAAKDTYGSVDIAFNNAGISPPEDASITVEAGEVFHSIACWLSAAASISPRIPGGLAELAK